MEKVAIEEICIESVRRVIYCFLTRVPGPSSVAEADRESGDPIIQQAKGRRSACVHCFGVGLFNFLQNIARALCQLQSFDGAAIVVSHRSLFTGDDS